MSFYSPPMKFGADSIIDELFGLEKSQRAPVNYDPHLDLKAFTFQQLPKQSDRMRITKHVYLSSDRETPYERHQPKTVSYLKEKIEDSRSIGNSRMDFFDDIEDFHSRKQQISKIQKKYLSVVSNDSQHKRSKKKTFEEQENPSVAEQKAGELEEHEQKLKNSENWLAKKRDSIKDVLTGLHTAMVSCYAHVPSKDAVLDKFDSIMERRK